ncbi:hypothetical protein PFICI_04914 [Pestalotiopsis fici W106-1]|uniref:RING-type E3 ubiquitin transferase n=1 Tax=Pestalotiopsis fici (strain W106-1 / CGMCC3.15140) TaxID=1229662 RepID=W3XAA8_PESFW|nr:uncharacterized protein PFICI_04914 [Pestalotiopsis fici W106-1]ETS83038.1 hypothetical protein PFICI_04914 [Pestalotiopsis fici W106-1]
MFTQPAPPSTTGLLSPTTDAASSSPSAVSSRGSRLRGLSYLRSYTQTHLLSRDSGISTQPSASAASGSPSSSTSASATQHTPLTRATHSALSVTSGRRRARQSGDPPSTSKDRNRKTTSAQNAQPGRDSSQDSQPEPNSDSDSGRGKKHKTGTEEDRQGATAESQDNQAQSSSAAAAADMARARSATTGDLSTEVLPSIRFSAHYDPRSTRQSLSFTPISRTLPTGKESIKVGRYSEREQQQIVPANIPSAAPVGFKSKVVSRRHCEFWHEDGKWYIKDVKSSSGTFLNHVRLSPPGNESKPFPVNDGDIVQLGIDFRGGEEMIFRCVKMRIELNRGWQSKPNNFNMATHKRLRNLTSTTDTNAGSGHAQDCSICLNAIAPCQSLFVAPCSHTWHYKCIRELLIGPSHPIFTCPNCRAAADLDADVEEPDEEWQQLDSGGEDVNMDARDTPEAPVDAPADRSTDAAQINTVDGATEELASQAPSAVEENGDVTMMLDNLPASADHAPTASETSTPIPIPRPSPMAVTSSNGLPDARRTPSPPNAGATVHDGPLTPRNDAGPWVFDGDAGRSSQDVSRPGAMVNLDAAATRVQSNAI